MAVSASNAYLAQVDPYVPSAAYDASIPQVEPTPAPAAAPSTQAAPVEQPGKDEVGWMFVEQYYTTLNKSPEKLHVSTANKSLSPTLLLGSLVSLLTIVLSYSFSITRNQSSHGALKEKSSNPMLDAT